jgi:hypothetical protein
MAVWSTANLGRPPRCATPRRPACRPARAGDTNPRALLHRRHVRCDAVHCTHVGLAHCTHVGLSVGASVPPQLLAGLDARFLHTLPACGPQDLSLYVHSVALLGEVLGARGFDAIARHAAEHAGQFDPQHVANVLWALATMRLAPPPFLVGALEVRPRRARARASLQRRWSRCSRRRPAARDTSARAVCVRGGSAQSQTP